MYLGKAYVYIYICICPINTCTLNDFNGLLTP